VYKFQSLAYFCECICLNFCECIFCECICLKLKVSLVFRVGRRRPPRSMVHSSSARKHRLCSWPWRYRGVATAGICQNRWHCKHQHGHEPKVGFLASSFFLTVFGVYQSNCWWLLAYGKWFTDVMLGKKRLWRLFITWLILIICCMPSYPQQHRWDIATDSIYLCLRICLYGLAYFVILA